MTRVRIGLVGVLAVSAAVVPVAPAGAAGVTFSVEASFSGIANLSTYPCPSGCTGFTVSDGYFAGEATVFDASETPVYEAVWPSGTAPNLTISNSVYSEDCVPTAGTAAGSFSVGNGVMMQVTPQGPKVVGTATLTGGYGVNRTGPVATFSTDSVQLLLNGTVVASAPAGSIGVMVMSPAIPPTAMCTAEPPVQIVFSGVYAQAA